MPFLLNVLDPPPALYYYYYTIGRDDITTRTCIIYIYACRYIKCTYTILCIRYKLKIDPYCTVAPYYYYYADYDDDCYRLIINSIERAR